MIDNNQEPMGISELMNFFPKQRHALDMAERYKYLLYGGSAGPGKSYWLRWYSIYKILKWTAQTGLTGIRTGLFCEDYPSLKDRHLSKIAYEFPLWLGEIKDSKENGLGFHLRPKFGGGVMTLRNLDDPSKYLSSEFALIAVDELTRNDELVFNVLRMRMRWTGIEDVRFVAATNPGQKGHGWVKRRWIDREFDVNEVEPEEFHYVPALPTDNPHLAQTYIEQLKSLPEKERKAYLEGDWNVFAGQFFTEFDPKYHVCAPFDIPDNWMRYMDGDYGYSKPSAIYWNAIRPEDGKVFTYRELYVTEHTGEMLAEKICDMTPERERDLIEWFVMDSNVLTAGREGKGKISVLDQMYEVLERKKWSLQLRLASKGPGSRVNGWNLMRGYLRLFPKGESFGSRWQIFSNCENLIRTIPIQVYNEKTGDPEDLDTDVEDHGPDAKRYGFRALSEPFVKEQIKEKKEKVSVEGNIAAKIAKIMEGSSADNHGSDYQENAFL